MAGVPRQTRQGSMQVSLRGVAPAALAAPVAHPNPLDVSAAVSRQAVVGAHALKRAAPAAPALLGKIASSATKAAPALAKFALPLTALAAGGAAIVEGARRYEKEGAAGAVKGAIRGAADSVTLGLASWAWNKAKNGQGFDARDQMAASKKPGLDMTHFSAANKKFTDQGAMKLAPKPQQQEPPKGGARGWANPKVQAAAQAAKGNAYSGPKG